jgi:hypothetical protein
VHILLFVVAGIHVAYSALLITQSYVRMHFWWSKWAAEEDPYLLRCAGLRACMHACMHGGMHECTSACMHEMNKPTHACMNERVSACMHECVRACILECIEACLMRRGQSSER